MNVVRPRSLVRILLCAVLLCGIARATFAQSDTLSIQEVALTIKKAGLSSLGKKFSIIDSATKEQFRFTNTAELLAYNGSVYIKSYGPGGIATTALRGGSAEQTAVLWNGMNLQNTMLGQTDLSTLPVILFESVGIEYGPGTSVWGGGAVGGSIHLGNNAKFGRQMRVTVAGSGGDQGQRNIAGVIVAGRNRIVNTTKIYSAASANNFKYRDLNSDSVRTMTNAPFSGWGFMNELKFTAGTRQVFSLNAWLNTAERKIASYKLSAPSKQSQNDNAIRLQGAWNYQRNNYRTQVRTAYLNEKIDYNDSLYLIFTKNLARTVMFDNEHLVAWGGGHEFHAGISYMGTSATTGYYDGRQQLSRYSFLAGNRFLFDAHKIEMTLNGRAEYFTAGTLPVTGNVALEYRPFKSLKAGINLSNFYRQPTLNELYWSPGGNRNLRPEQGEGADAIVSVQKEKQRISVKISFSAFTRNVRNWILWVPGVGGNPSPQNIQQVWSRGGETSWKLDFNSRAWRLGANINTSYVLSTVLQSEIQNSASVGKQLVYTPRYTAGGALTGGYKNTSLFLLSQYAGYRFTSTDNSSWLDPYFIISVRITHALRLRAMSIVLFGAVNNLLSEEYAMQAARPMPLRSYEVGLTINFNHKNKNENK
jgi:vitamin B12 transporter